MFRNLFTYLREHTQSKAVEDVISTFENSKAVQAHPPAVKRAFTYIGNYAASVGDAETSRTAREMRDENLHRMKGE
jgi:hypothetical protein